MFTGNVAYCGSGLLEGKCSLLDTLKVWVVSWTFNFLGCLLMVGLSECVRPRRAGGGLTN